MSKVTFKTTTNNNDNFQRAVASMLKEMHSSTNHNLDIMQTDDDKIVIQPMGGWNYHIDFNATPKEEKEKDRKVYHLHNDYDCEKYFVSLTPDQLNLLKWLYKNGFMSTDWEWEEIDKMEIEVI